MLQTNLFWIIKVSGLQIRKKKAGSCSQKVSMYHTQWTQDIY